MKYCTHCGAEILDEAVICPKCGCSVNGTSNTTNTTGEKKNLSGLKLAAFILMLLSTIACGFAIIPLAWCIPMTVSYYKNATEGRPVSVGFKVCSLLFVNLIAGVLMLCDSDPS